jgi:hypothetical protein
LPLHHRAIGKLVEIRRRRNAQNPAVRALTTRETHARDAGKAAVSIGAAIRGNVADNALIVLVTAVLSLAVTSKSLWIDEGFIATLARNPINVIASPLIATSDRQYPLYDLWITVWAHLFGYSEYWLRAANIPFAAVFVIGMSLSSRLIFSRRFAWMPLALSPFVWFYMNEARPYIMLLALSTVSIGSLGVALFGPRELQTRASWLFLWALLLAVSTHILEVLAIPGILVLIVAGVHGRVLDLKRLLVRAVRIAPLFALVFAYYVSTLAGAQGRREVAINSRSVAGPVFTLSSMYEQVGFAGLGPPRTSMRARPTKRAFLPYAWWLVSAIIAFGTAILLSIRRRPSSAAIALLCAWAVSFALATSIPQAIGGRILGRHLAAILPFMLIGSIGFFRSRVALVLIAAIFAVSDLRLSFVPEYGKDDYRAAVSDVLGRATREQGAIDWVADAMTANYYGLSLKTAPYVPSHAYSAWQERGKGTFVADWSSDSSRARLCAIELVNRELQSGPVFIAMNRPDIYDVWGVWSGIAHGATGTLVGSYEGFEIYGLRREKIADIGPSSGLAVSCRSAQQAAVPDLDGRADVEKAARIARSRAAH